MVKSYPGATGVDWGCNGVTLQPAYPQAVWRAKKAGGVGRGALPPPDGKQSGLLIVSAVCCEPPVIADVED